MEMNETIKEQINQFVSDNASKLKDLKTKNPDLHKAVLDTIQFLNDKYAGGQKPLVEMVSEEKKHDFHVGDLFLSPNAPKQIYQLDSRTDEKIEFRVHVWDQYYGQWNTERWMTDIDFVQGEIDLKNMIYVEGNIMDYMTQIRIDYPVQFVPSKPAPQPQPKPAATIKQNLSNQERINEIKDAIDGLKLLIELGDPQEVQDAKDEIKTLKKELKILKEK